MIRFPWSCPPQGLPELLLPPGHVDHLPLFIDPPAANPFDTVLPPPGALQLPSLIPPPGYNDGQGRKPPTRAKRTRGRAASPAPPLLPPAVPSAPIQQGTIDKYLPRTTEFMRDVDEHVANNLPGQALLRPNVLAGRTKIRVVKADAMPGHLPLRLRATVTEARGRVQVRDRPRSALAILRC